MNDEIVCVVIVLILNCYSEIELCISTLNL